MVSGVQSSGNYNAIMKDIVPLRCSTVTTGGSEPVEAPVGILSLVDSFGEPLVVVSREALLSKLGLDALCWACLGDVGS